MISFYFFVYLLKRLISLCCIVGDNDCTFHNKWTFLINIKTCLKFHRYPRRHSGSRIALLAINYRQRSLHRKNICPYQNAGVLTQWKTSGTQKRLHAVRAIYGRTHQNASHPQAQSIPQGKGPHPSFDSPQHIKLKPTD